MSNTLKRILSAIALVSVAALCLFFGKITTAILIFTVGLISIDELETNFFGYGRKDPSYILSQSIYGLSFGYFGFYLLGENTMSFVYLGVAFNLVLLLYLFFTDINSKLFINFLKSFPGFSGLLITLPILSTIHFIGLEHWIYYLILLGVINFGMDTAAWFWGKSFGRHKLWPSVSPKKTVEGLIGGVVSASLIGVLYYNTFLGDASVKLWAVFLFFALLSQLGDLIQSKIKRQMGIKDSSGLIPGHGGVYDRIDSVIFLAPFMGIALEFLSF